MGGNALKHLGVKRLNLEEYCSTIHKLEDILGCKLYSPSFFDDKNDFGDIDIVIWPETMPKDWLELVLKGANSKGYKKNGNVTSVEVDGFQVDFIDEPCFDSAIYYYSYGGIGSILGVIVKQMGLKLKTTGLYYPLVSNNGKLIKDILITNEAKKIRDFIGLYTETRAEGGWDNREQIFQMIGKSEYFHPDLFKTSSRKKPAKVYVEFCEWVEKNKKKLTHFDWSENNPLAHKSVFLGKTFALDFLAPLLEKTIQYHYEKHNGTFDPEGLWGESIITETIGLEGDAAKKFMLKLEQQYFFPFLFYQWQKSKSEKTKERFKNHMLEVYKREQQ